MDMAPDFLDQLFARGLLIPMGVDGLYGRSGVFEDVITRFDALVSTYGENDGAEVVRFPPGMSRSRPLPPRLSRRADWSCTARYASRT